MKNIAIFASGGGSNAGKIMEYFAGSQLAKVSLVASNKPNAFVLERAKKYGVETLVFDRPFFYESEKILEILARHKTDLIVLAGFLWLVPPYLVKKYAGRMVNIHPALLPKFGGKGMYGMHVHKAVKEQGDNISGITIHHVNEKYDEGSTIFQATCILEKGDSAEEIARKVLKLEHIYYPKVIEQVIRDSISQQG